MKFKEILKGVIYGNVYIMPLRKELLFGCLIILGLGSFCSAGSLTFSGTTTNGFSFSVPSSSCNVYYVCEFSNFVGVYEFAFQGYNYYMTTSQSNSYGQYPVGVNINKNLGRLVYTGDYNTSNNGNCISPIGVMGKIIAQSSYSVDWSCTLYGDNLLVSSSSCPTCPECPTCPSQYTSEECQSEYGLVSSGVLNSCQSSLSGCQSDLLNCQNSLSGYDTLLNNCSTNLNSCNSSLSSCLQLNCPVSSGGVSWSSLFINDIQHIGAPTINISIPSEIQWDYLNENDEFNLTVDGYNTDTDYIEGIINIQNSKPSKEDFNYIITGLVPLFVPGLVIILFIYFVFKLIKKIF